MTHNITLKNIDLSEGKKKICNEANPQTQNQKIEQSHLLLYGINQKISTTESPLV